MMPTDSTSISEIAVILSIFGSPQLGDRFAYDFLG
jgi:hypothetical protein